MKKKTRNILIASGAAAVTLAAVGAVSHAITTYLVKVALDREVPKTIKKSSKARDQLRGYEDLEGIGDMLKAGADALISKQPERVEISGFDGEKLVGHWYPAENPKRIIVAMHGWRSSWANDFGAIADFWHDNGCSVLYPEQRGQGESGGEYMGFGLIERHDCLEWVRFINQKTGGILPIYLAGISMGASTVLMASSLDMPENMRGIIADCGFTSPHAIWKHVMENNLHMSYGIRARIVDDMCKKRIKMGAKEYSTTTALAENKLPVLFIHGTDDHFVPVEMTYENYKACIAPKQLLVVPGADHGMSYFINRDEYEKANINFWQKYDNPLCQSNLQDKD